MSPSREKRDGRVRLTIFGHPLHVSIVHLPIGVLGSVAVWDALALLREEAFWWSLSFWSLALGTLAALPAAATGLLDYAGLPDESPATPVAGRHMTCALSAVFLYGASLLLRGTPGPQAEAAGLLPVGVAYLALVFLAVTGWLGGELTLRHGVGRVPDEVRE